jgi:hypothetical protein
MYVTEKGTVAKEATWTKVRTSTHVECPTETVQDFVTVSVSTSTTEFIPASKKLTDMDAEIVIDGTSVTVEKTESENRDSIGVSVRITPLTVLFDQGTGGLSGFVVEPR